MRGNCLTYMLLALASVQVIAATCFGKILRRGVSCHDKKIILDSHNRFRQQVALGKVRGQPPAANMLQMYWDAELARTAQDWADRCPTDHDPNRSLRRFSFGQNMGFSWSSPNPTSLGSEPDFTTYIKYWFNEVYSPGYHGIFTPGSGHYSQLVWGDTYLVGCGYSYYQTGSKFNKVYVCNYGPGGNIVGASPYKSGQPSCSLHGTFPSRKHYGLCEVKGQS